MARNGRAAAALLVPLLAVACEGGVLGPRNDGGGGFEELTPQAVPQRLAGMVDDFREMYDDYALYAGLHTDELRPFASGTGGWEDADTEVEERRPEPTNEGIAADLWTPLSLSRATTDAADRQFTEALGRPEFAGVAAELERGIAYARLLGGYTRIFFAELFCQSILAGGAPEGPGAGDSETAPLSSAETMREALNLLASAERFADSATTAGLTDIADAARVGQARAHVYLGSATGDASHFRDAADVVAGVDDAFAFTLEFSAASPRTENEVFRETWGRKVDTDSWSAGPRTVGEFDDGTFSYFDEWVAQGLIDPDPFVSVFHAARPPNFQTLYGGRSGTTGPEAPMVLASGWEARMAEAENLLRNGSPGAAETVVDALLTDPDQASNPMLAVTPTLTEPAPPGAGTTNELGAFPEVTFGDEPLAGDLVELARAREAGLWLTGDRQATLRRFAEEFDDRLALGLWPDRSSANTISLPVPDVEVDRNPHISSTCPPGLP